ncbi:hypothetical protein EJD97_021638 [Solanum chilense]|uniref:Uncharacterized protein n=1 Tax=Solanum chilense TaxID=4083 RepID=A0A6N2B2Y0_SOLCI|nr:hypothetical protein EJD97_021638 [Solanum chilense]
MSRKVSGTPRKSRRLVEESSSDDFHVPSFNILTQTQSKKSTEKETASSVKSKIEKNKNKKRQRKEGRRGREKKFEHRQNLILTLLMN